MTEYQWIEHLRRRIPVAHGELVLGIGDDCAIYRPRGANEDLLLTTDLMIEGVHFRREEVSPAFIGHKSLARGLSDIAAMGGEPKFCLVSLAIPKTWQRHVDEFYRGLLRLARQSGTQVAGGDLSKANRIAVDIIVCGAVKKGNGVATRGSHAWGHYLCVRRAGPLGRARISVAAGTAAPAGTFAARTRQCLYGFERRTLDRFVPDVRSVRGCPPVLRKCRWPLARLWNRLSMVVRTTNSSTPDRLGFPGSLWAASPALIRPP